jgi:hypothetical protein
MPIPRFLLNRKKLVAASAVLTLARIAKHVVNQRSTVL